MVIAFVPLVECEACLGLGLTSGEELKWLIENRGTNVSMTLSQFHCKWCADIGRTTVLREFLKEPSPNDDLSRVFERDAIHKILERRNYIP